MAAEENRTAVHSAIQAVMHDDGAREAQGNVVVGWACVVESMAPNGRRWLSRLSSDASGERRLPEWTEQGLLFNALHTQGWDYGNDDEEREA